MNTLKKITYWLVHFFVTDDKLQPALVDKSAGISQTLVMGKILDFLFGKEPEIFNDAGKVQHKLPRARWDDWENRFKSNPLYNWRLHTGTQAGAPTTEPDARNLKKS